MSDSLEITSVPTGILQVNTYIITSADSAAVIDPGGNIESILPHVESKDNILVLLTHSHYDHIGGINELLEALPHARYYAHQICAQRAADPSLNLSFDHFGIEYATRPADHTLTDKEKFSIGDIEFQALHIPGHAPGHLCYYLPTEKAVFCGDTIFAHSIGRSDLPGGDGWDLVQHCREMLAFLPEETVLYPGHGPATTVKEEKATNPFL